MEESLGETPDLISLDFHLWLASDIVKHLT